MPCIRSCASMSRLWPVICALLFLLALTGTASATNARSSAEISATPPYRQNQRQSVTVTLPLNVQNIMDPTSGNCTIKIRCSYPLDCVSGPTSITSPFESHISSDTHFVLENDGWLTLYKADTHYVPLFSGTEDEDFTFKIDAAFPDMGFLPAVTSFFFGYTDIDNEFQEVEISTPITSATVAEDDNSIPVLTPAVDRVFVTLGNELHVSFYSPIAFTNASVLQTSPGSAARFALRLPPSMYFTGEPSITMALTKGGNSPESATISAGWVINDLSTGLEVDNELRWSAYIPSVAGGVWCDPCTLTITNVDATGGAQSPLVVPQTGYLRIIGTDMRYTKTMTVQPPMPHPRFVYNAVMKPVGSTHLPMGEENSASGVSGFWDLSSTPVDDVFGILIFIPPEIRVPSGSVSVVVGSGAVQTNPVNSGSSFIRIPLEEMTQLTTLKVEVSPVIGPIPLAPSTIKITAIDHRYLTLAEFAGHVVSESGTLNVECHSPTSFRPRPSTISLSCVIADLKKRLRHVNDTIIVSLDIGASRGLLPGGISLASVQQSSSDLSVGAISTLQSPLREFDSVRNAGYFSLTLATSCMAVCFFGSIELTFDVNSHEFGITDLQDLYLRFGLVVEYDATAIDSDRISAPYASGMVSFPFEEETSIPLGDIDGAIEHTIIVVLGDMPPAVSTHSIYAPSFINGSFFFEVITANMPEDVLSLTTLDGCTSTKSDGHNLWVVTCGDSVTLGNSPFGTISFTFTSAKSLDLIASRVLATFSTRVYLPSSYSTYAAVTSRELRPSAVSEVHSIRVLPFVKSYVASGSPRSSVALPPEFLGFKARRWAANDAILISFADARFMVDEVSDINISVSRDDTNCIATPSWDPLSRTATLKFTELCSLTGPDLTVSFGKMYWQNAFASSSSPSMFITTIQSLGPNNQETALEMYTFTYSMSPGTIDRDKEEEHLTIHRRKREPFAFPVELLGAHGRSVVSPMDSLYLTFRNMDAVFPRPPVIDLKSPNSGLVKSSVFGVGRDAQNNNWYLYRRSQSLYAPSRVFDFVLPQLTVLKQGDDLTTPYVRVLSTFSRSGIDERQESTSMSLLLTDDFPHTASATAAAFQTGMHQSYFVMRFTVDYISPVAVVTSGVVTFQLKSTGDKCVSDDFTSTGTLSTANGIHSCLLIEKCLFSCTLTPGPSGYILPGDLLRVTVQDVYITGVDRVPAELKVLADSQLLVDVTVSNDAKTEAEAFTDDRLPPLIVDITPINTDPVVVNKYLSSIVVTVPVGATGFSVSSASSSIEMDCGGNVVTTIVPECESQICENGKLTCTFQKSAAMLLNAVLTGITFNFHIPTDVGPDVVRIPSFDQQPPYHVVAAFADASIRQAVGFFRGYPSTSSGSSTLDWTTVDGMRALKVVSNLPMFLFASAGSSLYAVLRGPAAFLDASGLSVSAPFTTPGPTDDPETSHAYLLKRLRLNLASEDLPSDSMPSPELILPPSGPSMFGRVTFSIDAGDFTYHSRILGRASELVTSPMHFFVGPTLNSFRPTNMGIAHKFDPFTEAKEPVIEISTSLDGSRLLFSSRTTLKVYNVLDPFALTKLHGCPSEPVMIFAPPNDATILTSLLSRDGRWLLTVTSKSPSSITVTKVTNINVVKVFDLSVDAYGYFLKSVTYLAPVRLRTTGSDTILACGPDQCLVLAISLDGGYLSPLTSYAFNAVAGPKLVASGFELDSPSWRGLTSNGDLVHIGNLNSEFVISTLSQTQYTPGVRELEYRGLTALAEIHHDDTFSFNAVGDNLGFVMLVKSGAVTNVVVSMVRIPCTTSKQCGVDTITVQTVVREQKLDFYLSVFISDGSHSIVRVDSSFGAQSLTILKTPIVGAVLPSFNSKRTAVFAHPAGSVIYVGTSTGEGFLLGIPLADEAQRVAVLVEQTPWDAPPVSPPSSEPLRLPLGSVVTLTVSVSVVYRTQSEDKIRIELPRGSRCLEGSTISLKGTGFYSQVRCVDVVTASSTLVTAQPVITFEPYSVPLPESFEVSITRVQLAHAIPAVPQLLIEGSMPHQLFAVSIVAIDDSDQLRFMFHSGDLSVGTLVPGYQPRLSLSVSRDSDAAMMPSTYTVSAHFNSFFAPGSYIITVSLPPGFLTNTNELPSASFGAESGAVGSVVLNGDRDVTVDFTIDTAANDTLIMEIPLTNPSSSSSSRVTAVVRANSPDSKSFYLQSDFLPPLTRQVGAQLVNNYQLASTSLSESLGSSNIVAAAVSADGRLCAAVSDVGFGLVYEVGNTWKPTRRFSFPGAHSYTHLVGSRNLRSLFLANDRGLVVSIPVVPKIDGQSSDDFFLENSAFYDSERFRYIHEIGNILDIAAALFSSSVGPLPTLIELVVVTNPRAPIMFDTDGVAGLFAVTSHGLIQLMPAQLPRNDGSLGNSHVFFPDDTITTCNVATDDSAGYVRCLSNSGKLYISQFDVSAPFELQPSTEWQSTELSDTNIPAVALAPQSISPLDTSGTRIIWAGMADGRIVRVERTPDAVTAAVTGMSRSTTFIPSVLAVTTDGRSVQMGTTTSETAHFIVSDTEISPVEQNVQRKVSSGTAEPNSFPINRALAMQYTYSHELIVIFQHAVQVYKALDSFGDITVGFTRPEDNVPNHSLGLDAARVATAEITFKWHSLPSSPFASWSSGDALVVNLLLDYNALTRYGSSLEFAQELPDRDMSYYSLLSGSEPGSLHFGDHVETVSCTFARNSLQCDAAADTGLAAKIDSSLGGHVTVRVPGVIPPPFITLEYHATAFMLKSQNTPVFLSSDVHVYGAYGVLHLNSISPSNVTLRVIGSRGEHSEVFFNPALEYRNGGFEPFAVTLSSYGNGCDDISDAYSNDLPLGGKGPCCSFSSDGSDNSYRPVLERKITSAAFTSRLEVFVICSIGEGGVPVRVVPSSSKRTEQARYSPLTQVVHGTAALAVQRQGSSSITMKTGAFYAISVVFDSSLARTGVSKSPISVRVKPPSQYCFLCTSQTTTDCKNEGLLTIPAGQNQSPDNVLFARCVQAGENIGDFYLAYDPARDSIPYTGKGMSVLAVEGSLSINFDPDTMPMPLNHPITLKVTLDTPALSNLEVQIEHSATEGDCRVYHVGESGNPDAVKNPKFVIAKDAESVSFDFVCKKMLHTDDGFTLKAIETNEDMSSGESPVVSTYGVSKVQMLTNDINTGDIVAVDVADTGVEIAASDITAFQVLMDPTPSRGSMFTVTVSNPAPCFVSYSTAEFSNNPLPAGNNTLVNIVGYSAATTTDLFYVLCPNPMPDILQLVVTHSHGDEFRYASAAAPYGEKTAKSFTFDTRAVGALRLYRVRSFTDEDETSRFMTDVDHNINANEVIYMRVDLLPDASEGLTFTLLWNTVFDCKIWRATEPETSGVSNYQVNVAEGARSIHFATKCTKPIITNYDSAISVLKISGPEERYPTLELRMKVQIAVRLLLSDSSEVPTSLAVAAPLHVHISSDHNVRAQFRAKLTVTSNEGSCQISRSLGAGYSKSITVNVENAVSGSVYVQCSEMSTGSTSVTIESAEPNNYRIAPWALQDVTSRGTIYLSPSPTDSKAALPSVITQSVPQILYVHLIPKTNAEVTFTFAKTSAAGSVQPNCGFSFSSDTATNDHAVVTMASGLIVSTAVYFTCTTVTEGGPSITITPGLTTYSSYTGTTILPRGSYAYYSATGEALGNILPFQTPYMIKIKLLPEASQMTFGFTVSLSSFAAGCTFAFSEDEFTGSTIQGLSSLTFIPTYAHRDFLNFFIYCKESALQGPALIVSPAPNVLFAQGTTPQFTVSGVMRAVAVTPAFGPDRNVMFPTELSIGIPSDFTFIVMPKAPTNVTIQAELIDSGGCILEKRESLSGSRRQDITPTRADLTVYTGVDSPSSFFFEGMPTYSLVITCHNLMTGGAQPRIKLTQANKSDARYEDYIAEHAFSISGAMKLSLGSSSHAELEGQRIQAATNVRLTLTLTPPPSSSSTILIDILNDGATTYDCKLGLGDNPTVLSKTLLITVGLGASDTLLTLRCNHITKPNTITVRAMRQAGDHYTTLEVPRVSVVSSPTVEGSGNTMSHSPKVMKVKLLHGPRQSTRFRVEAVSQDNTAVSGGCYFSAEAFPPITSEAQLDSFSGYVVVQMNQGQTEVEFSMYCKSPVQDSKRAPRLSVTAIGGDEYDSFLTTPFEVYAKDCARLELPHYSRMTPDKQAGGFYDPSYYPGTSAADLFVLKNTFTYTCETGYHLPTGVSQANTLHVCTPWGWEGQVYPCIPVMCNARTTADFGDLHLSASSPAYSPRPNALPPDTRYSFGAELTVTCLTGYVYAQRQGQPIVSTQKVTCADNGSWRPLTACALVDCYTAARLADGGKEPQYPEGTKYGATVRFECHDGYVIENPETVAVCSALGAWTFTPGQPRPSCKAERCIRLSDPDHGRIEFDPPFTDNQEAKIGDTATYICDEGYIATDGDVMRVCQTIEVSTGNSTGWSSTPPTCEPNVCASAEDLVRFLNISHAVEMHVQTADGIVIPYDSFDDNFTYGMSVIVTCETGYDYGWISGVRRRPTCDANHRIRNEDTICAPHICPFLPENFEMMKPVIYGSSTRSYNTNATYQCVPGFRPTPTMAAVKVCREAGVEWQPAADVSCVPQSCPKLNSIRYGKDITYISGGHGELRYLSKATYSCEDGFSIRDISSSVRTCGDGGVWQGTEPVCAPFNCGPYKIDEISTMVSYSASGFGPTELGARARISCRSGFNLKSVDEAVCTPTGWSIAESMIKCEDINECDIVSCRDMYGPGSYCINTMGSYVCTPFITTGSVVVSGHLKHVTVQYPFTGVVNETTKDIRIVDTAGRDSLTFDIFVGFGTVQFSSGPHAGATIDAITYTQTVSPFLEFSCAIQTTQPTESSQYRRITCLTSPAAGLVLPIKMKFCSFLPYSDDVNGSRCRWTHVNLSGRPDDTQTLPFVYRLNYPPPATVAATLRSLTNQDRTGRSNLVGRHLDKGELIAILGSGFHADAMEVKYGPKGDEKKYDCPLDHAKTTPTTMACQTLDGIKGVDLYFHITVNGQSVISQDRFSYPLTLTLVSVRGCATPGPDEESTVQTAQCPTMGGTALTIRGDGFLDPTAVYVKGIECPITRRENTVITCTLPPGSGRRVSVIVSSGSQYTEGPAMLSYALPTITSITSDKCLSYNSTYLYDCPRQQDPKNKAWLTLHGSNFGAESASVYIGGTICQELYHHSDPVIAHTQVRCVIPPGTSTDNEVRLVQMYGESSQETITLSYTQCAAGYFTSGSSCELCPLGQFTSEIGQSECKQCAAGTYAPVVGTSSCLSCPAGSYSGIGASLCLPCPKGTYAPAGSGLCTTCSVGTFSDKVRSATCLACPNGGLSDPDYAGCHCGSGYFMNALGTCEACMDGGDCTAAHTTFYNVLPRRGFYPTALATDTKAPSVERHIIDLLIDVNLNDDYAAQVFLSRWYEAIYNETGISRSRAQVVNVAMHMIPVSDDNVPAVNSGSSPQGDPSVAKEHRLVSGPADDAAITAQDYALRNGSASTREVRGVRVTLDILPPTLRTDEPSSAVAQRLWALMGQSGTYMHNTFSSALASRALVGSFGRTAYVAFEPCLHDSCVGGDTLCAQGYEGPLCSVCSAGYGKVSTYKCESCGSLGSRIGWMFFSVLIAVVIVGILVFLSLRDTNKNFHLPRAIRPSSFAAFLKIIICTIQVWAIAAQYDIAWPGILHGLMSAISAAGNVGVRASALDCFSTESGYGSSMTTVLRPLFLTSTAVFILPFLAVVIPCLVLLPAWYIHRRRYTSIMETVEYTVAWSNQIEARLKEERLKMDAEAEAERTKHYMASRAAAETEATTGSSHSRRALSSRRDLVSSETAMSLPTPMSPLPTAGAPSRRMNITLNTGSHPAPGAGPLPPPVAPPTPGDSAGGIEMQSFHVNDFAEPPTPAGSVRSGSGVSQSGASARTAATGASLRGATARPSVRRRKAEKSFRETLLEAERYTNKGVAVREQRLGRGASAVELSTMSASMRDDSIGDFSVVSTTTTTTGASGSNRLRSKDKAKMNIEDQSAADYTQFQRDKRVYRTMVAKLAELKSYYMCVFFCCIVVALYLLHPNITIAFFRLVGCKTVGSGSSSSLRSSLAGSGLTLGDVVLPHSSRRFVLADMSLSCGSSEHLLWVFTLGLAIFAFWVVGIPLTFFLFTYKNRVVLSAQPNALPRAHLRLRRNLELTFAFLFLGYELRAFYWFLVDMLSKVLYAAIMIFFPGEMHIQFLLASFIAFLIITGQTAIRPFDSAVLEQLQFAALLCTFACFFLANFFVVDTELSQFGVDIIKWIIFAAVILFFVIALITLYLMYVHDQETESIRKSVMTAIRRNIDPVPLLQEWQRNLANTEEQLRLKKHREAYEKEKESRLKARKGMETNDDERSDSDAGDDLAGASATGAASSAAGGGRARAIRGIGSIAVTENEAAEDEPRDEDLLEAGLDEEEQRMRIKRKNDALDAQISSFFSNPTDERKVAADSLDAPADAAAEDVVDLTNNETFTGDFITEDMRRRAEERAWEAAEDAKNPILKTRKEQLRMYRANLAEELGLAGLTDAQVEALLRSTSALPRSARKEDRMEWALHASGVQDPQGDLEEKRRALKARKVAPAAAAAEAVMAGTGELNPVRRGYLGRTTVASAAAMADEEVPIENEEDFFFKADEADAIMPPNPSVEQEQYVVDEETAAAVAAEEAAAVAQAKEEAKAAAAAARGSLVASQTLLAPRASTTRPPAAEKTTMSVKTKQDGSTEIRVGTAKRGHVIKLVRRKKGGAAAASSISKATSKPPTDVVNSMVAAAAAAVKRANGEEGEGDEGDAAEEVSQEASVEASPTAAAQSATKAKKAELSTSRSGAASSMSQGPVSTIPGGASNSSDRSSSLGHSMSQSPSHSRENSK